MKQAQRDGLSEQIATACRGQAKPRKQAANVANATWQYYVKLLKIHEAAG